MHKKWIPNESWKDELAKAVSVHKDVQRSTPDEWLRRKSLFRLTSQKVQNKLNVSVCCQSCVSDSVLNHGMFSVFFFYEMLLDVFGAWPSCQNG